MSAPARVMVEHRCPKCSLTWRAYEDETVYCPKHPDYRKGVIGTAMIVGARDSDQLRKARRAS